MLAHEIFNYIRHREENIIAVDTINIHKNSSCNFFVMQVGPPLSVVDESISVDISVVSDVSLKYMKKVKK